MIDTMATSTLEQEHGMILQVITRMATVADDLDRGGKIEPTVLQESLEFFRILVEQAHDRKEESLLFTAREKKGVPADACPLAVLRDEHMKARALVSELTESVSAYAATCCAGGSVLIGALRHLAAFHAGHMWTEDYLLLPDGQ